MDATKSTSRRQGPAPDLIREPETASPARGYPRLSLRVSGHDITKPDGSGGRVNAAVVHGQFTCLSLGDLSGMRRVGRVNAITWNLESALHGNKEGDQTEVRSGHSSPGATRDEGPNVEVSGGLP